MASAKQERRERKRQKRAQGRRPDHDSTLVDVRCESCGSVQANRTNSLCLSCKHPYASYAERDQASSITAHEPLEAATLLS